MDLWGVLNGRKQQCPVEYPNRYLTGHDKGQRRIVTDLDGIRQELKRGEKDLGYGESQRTIHAAKRNKPAHGIIGCGDVIGTIRSDASGLSGLYITSTKITKTSIYTACRNGFRTQCRHSVFFNYTGGVLRCPSEGVKAAPIFAELLPKGDHLTSCREFRVDFAVINTLKYVARRL